MTNINLTRKPSGLSLKVLEFLSERQGKVEAAVIGTAIYGIYLENPRRRVGVYILPSLCRKRLIRKLPYGYYQITEKGKRLVEEMNNVARET